MRGYQRSGNMIKTLNVIFDGKVFRPEEPVDLESDTHFFINIYREGIKI